MRTDPDKQLHGDSTTYKNWMYSLAVNSCKTCKNLHGTIYPIAAPPHIALVHINCACTLVPMRTKRLGTSTEDRLSGADVSIACLGKLPDNYVDKNTAAQSGWKRKKGNLREILPDATIGGDVYLNDDDKLPQNPLRVWHEADIDYNGGFRGDARLLYSNDGLLFVTYDHYHTFYEILQ